MAALSALAAAAQHYAVGREEVVLQQGASCEDGLFFVVKGSFRVVQELPVFARATNEEAAARLFALPPLTEEAAADQRRRIQAAAERHQQRLQSLDAASPYSSQASLHSTFLTAQSRSSQSLAQQSPPSPRHRKGHAADGRRTTGNSNGVNASAMELPSVHEHARHVDEASSMLGEEEGYTDLAAYDSRAEAKQQPQRSQRGSGRGHGHGHSPRGLPPQISSQHTAAGSSPAAAPAPKCSVIVGSRFLEVNQLGPHAVFGEVGVMMQCPRTASVISRTSGGELFAITKFDFLRLQSRRALHELRAHAGSSYRSAAELQLELDDSQQWERYKAHLLAVSRDRRVPSHKLHQMPVFESVPVKSFALRLPKLRDQLEDDPMQLRMKRTSARKETDTAAQRATMSPYSSHTAGAGAPVAAAASPRASGALIGGGSSPAPSRRALDSYSNGSGLNIVERYSSRRAISTSVLPASAAVTISSGSSGGSHTERSGKKKGVKLSAHSTPLSAR